MKYRIILLVAIVILGFLLRFVDVSSNPPGLYIDEASIGYNAYQILTTGKDEFGIPHPLLFRSYGDYKMPIYIYSVTGAMALLGKTELAIRLPSIIAGTLTILFLYLFLDQLLQLETDKKLQKKLVNLPLLASFFLAISSWHIQFSRGGFEITVGTFFFLVGCYLYAVFKKKRYVYAIIGSILFFIFAIYTYLIFRALTPLALLFIAFDQRIYKNKQAIPFVIGTFLLLLPLGLFILTPEGNSRFIGTSTFSQFSNMVHPDMWQKAIMYPLLFLNNYLSFFSLDFLFTFGDGIGRHQIPHFGELFRWQIPFFLGGIYLLFKQHKSAIKFATLLLFFSVPIAGAVAVPSPHTLRSLPLVIPCMTFTAIGVLFFFQNIKKLKFLAYVLIILIASYEFFLYLHFYYIYYPRSNQLDWGASYKQLVLTTTQEEKMHHYQHIVIDDTGGVLQFTPTYFHFYNPSLHVTILSPYNKEPETWKNSNVLYIRPYYGQSLGNGLVTNIYLTNLNKDIFAQLWLLK